MLLADAAWKSVINYSTPYVVDAELAPGKPLTDRLVLIVLDGIRRDIAEHGMTNLHALAARGNRRTMKTVLPSLSNPARATFVTGAGPDVHGVTNNGHFHPPPVQSLFSLARKQGLPVTVYGGRFWTEAFGAHLDPANMQGFEKEMYEVDDPNLLIDWQGAVCDAMVPFLAARPKGLLVAGLTAADEAGHDYGGRSDEYKQVALAVDACLGRIVEALDDGETTFVVASDHGHIQRRGHGGHGGAENAVTTVPLVLAGKGIKPGAGLAYQIDVAPTIAALLGLPLPASNQGAVLFDALDLDAGTHEALDRRMREQLEVFAQRTPNRRETIERERSQRLPQSLAAGLALLLALGLAIAKIPVPKQRLFWSVAAFVVVYFGLFWALGVDYSLSSIIREEYLNSFFARDVAAAAISFAAAAFLARRGLLWLGLILIALFGLRVAIIHYKTGLIMGAVMPDLDMGLMAYLDLLAIFGVAATACAAAAIVWLRSRHVRALTDASQR